MELNKPSAEYRPAALRETELGPLPADWVNAQLREITNPDRPISYGIVQTGPRVTNGVPCLRVVDIHNGKIQLDDLITTSVEISNSYRRTKLREGDLVVPLRGKVGECAQVPEPLIDANLTRGVAIVAVLPRYSARYCKQFFSSTRSRARLNRAMNGSALQEIPIATLRTFKIALPPTIEEQRAIAQVLCDADALIDSLEQLLAKKRQIKQGAMQELLTGKRRLPGFTQPWHRNQLSQLGIFLKGVGVKRDQASSGDLPCVRYGEIYTEHSNYIRAFRSWISVDVASNATKLHCGDLLFAGSGETKEEIGKCVAFLDDTTAYAGGDIVILRPTAELDSMYLGYLLNTQAVVRQKASKGQGDAVVHISAAALGHISIDLPAPSEQIAIAQVLSDIDADIATLEFRLTKAWALKQAMAQALLTGRIRLMGTMA